jgi:hypothetical protein
MKYLKLFAGSFFLVALNVYGQKSEKFVINPGQKISDVLTVKDIYEFPEFKKGTVFIGSKDRVEALLNYNLLTQTIQFVSSNGDTLSLADEETIKTINIDGKVYLFNKGYYGVNDSFEMNKFLLRKRIRIESVKKIGVYDQTVEGGANSYSNFSSGATDVNLILNQKITLVKEEANFFSDRNGTIYNASKKSFLNLLSKHRKETEDYIEKKAINFKNKNDIQKLIDYLNSL